MKPWILPVGIITTMLAFLFFMFFVIRPMASEEEDIELQRDHCIEILRCIDLGVERSHCDELFPKCEELQQ